MSWTGIDPSHVDLQHLANDHSTTRATGESSYFSIVANLFLLVYNEFLAMTKPKRFMAGVLNLFLIV